MNTGNGNTFWTTNVPLTVTPGNTVTLTDVTLNYWAVGGGGVQNVNRRSDFTVTLFNPSSGTVEAVTVADTANDAFSNSPTPVTLTFTTARTLALPGTYLLQIKGGDFTGTDETGNHTAIDDLSINGTVVAVPEPSTALLGGLGLLALLRRRR